MFLQNYFKFENSDKSLHIQNTVLGRNSILDLSCNTNIGLKIESSTRTYAFTLYCKPSSFILYGVYKNLFEVIPPERRRFVKIKAKEGFCRNHNITKSGILQKFKSSREIWELKKM